MLQRWDMNERPVKEEEGFGVQLTLKFRPRCGIPGVFLMRGEKDHNELPSGTNAAHWAEQQNLVMQLTRRSKTDASTLSVRWA